MSVCVCVYSPLCVKQRNDDEAVVDRGGTHYQQRSSFEQEDLEGTLNDTECIWNTKSLKQRVHLLSGFTLLLSSWQLLPSWMIRAEWDVETVAE